MGASRGGAHATPSRGAGARLARPRQPRASPRLHAHPGASQPDLALPLYVFGPSGGGKSGVIRGMLRALGARHAVLDCVSCGSSRTLFESALTQLNAHVPRASNGYAGWSPCDSAAAFVAGLQQAVGEHGRVVLVLERAEYLGQRHELRALLLSLHTLCATAAVSTVFVGEAVWPDAHACSAFASLVCVRFGGYNKDQLATILSLDSPANDDWVSTTPSTSRSAPAPADDVANSDQRPPRLPWVLQRSAHDAGLAMPQLPPHQA